MLGAVVLWLATAVFAGANMLDDASGAYEIGYALGAGTGGLLLAALIRLIYVKLTPWGRGKPDAAPAFFVLAAALTLLLMFGRELRDKDPVERYANAADACAAGEESPIAAAGGFEVRELDAARLAQWERQTQGLAPDEFIARVEPFEVAADGRLVAVGSSVPGLAEHDREGFLSGAIDGAGLGRAAVSPFTIDDEPGYLVRSPRLSAVVTYQGCWGVAVYAPDRGTVTEVARSIARG